MRTSKASYCILLVTGILMLASCASTPYQAPASVENRSIGEANNPSDGDTVTPLADSGNIHIEHAERFQRLAEQTYSQDSNNQRIDAILSAAEYYIQGNDFQQAERAVMPILAIELTKEQRHRLTVVTAYVAYSRGDCLSTLNQLNTILSQPELEIEPEIEVENEPEIDPLLTELLSEESERYAGLTVIDKEWVEPAPKLTVQQLDALLLSSFCYQSIGNYDAAIASLLEREANLSGLTRNETTRYIWQVINTLNSAQRQTVIQNTQNALVKARLEQSLFGQIGKYNPQPQQFTQWRENGGINNPVIINNNWDFQSPRHIAVLLPLTSQFSKAAQAVMDGIKYQHESNTSPAPPRLSFYDITDNPFQVSQYYLVAVQNGADFVIGPLGREYANQLSSYLNTRTSDATTILLGGDNELQNSTNRLTLSPEREGVMVAQKAAQDGHLSAALLVPNNLTSQRTATAFRQKWLSLGGKISKVVNYSNQKFDHSDELKQLFGVYDSENRYRALGNALGFNPKFAAYQRSDIDFVFMIANTDTGRLLKPQINFFSGSKVPVYATSSIFNGIQDTVNNMDLEETHFPIMPWVIRSAEVAQYAGQLNQLFALGADAYQLAGNLSELKNNPITAINGNTGRLSINQDRQVTSQPLWATFRNGEAVVTQTLGIDITPIIVPEAQPDSLPEAEGNISNTPKITSQGNAIYNDSNWDARNSGRKTSP